MNALAVRGIIMWSRPLRQLEGHWGHPIPSTLVHQGKDHTPGVPHPDQSLIQVIDEFLHWKQQRLLLDKDFQAAAFISQTQPERSHRWTTYLCFILQVPWQITDWQSNLQMVCHVEILPKFFQDVSGFLWDTSNQESVLLKSLGQEDLLIGTVCQRLPAMLRIGRKSSIGAWSIVKSSFPSSSVWYRPIGFPGSSHRDTH